MTAGDSKAALTITPQPALAPSPQPRPAPTARALPPGLVAQVGQNWTPIVGQNWMPIDTIDKAIERTLNALLVLKECLAFLACCIAFLSKLVERLKDRSQLSLDDDIIVLPTLDPVNNVAGSRRDLREPHDTLLIHTIPGVTRSHSGDADRHRRFEATPTRSRAFGAVEAHNGGCVLWDEMSWHLESSRSKPAWTGFIPLRGGIDSTSLAWVSCPGRPPNKAACSLAGAGRHTLKRLEQMLREPPGKRTPVPER